MLKIKSKGRIKIIFVGIIMFLLINSLRYKSQYIKLINYNYQQTYSLADKRYVQLSNMDYVTYDFEQFLEDLGYIGGIDRKFLYDIRLSNRDFRSIYEIISFSNYKHGDFSGKLKEEIDWNDDVKILVYETFKEYYYIIKENTNREISFFSSFFNIDKDYRKMTDDINKIAASTKEKLYKLLIKRI